MLHKPLIIFLDFVYIFDGNTTKFPALYNLTGYYLPQIISTPGPVITIQFVSDQLISYEGFSLNYTIANCESRCNGNGYCIYDECTCIGGWKVCFENEFDNFINLTKILQGPYCNETWCSDDSCGAGVCINGEYCDCPPNHYGADCSWGKYLKSVAFRILKSS